MTRQRLAKATLALFLLSAASGCSDDKPKGQCSGFEKCGGDVEGTWAIATSCVEGNLTALANAAAGLNPAVPADCRGMYKSVNGSMTGTVEFAAGTAHVNTTLTMAFEVMIEGACAAGYGVTTLDALNCVDLGPDMVPKVVENQQHTQIACLLEGNLCHCSAIDEILTQEDRTYTISDSSIKYSGANYPLDFCVKDGVMHGRQFDANLIATIFINASRQ
jgi:hypothetical protein